MSKTDQMRALREAKFTRSSAPAPRRASPTPAAVVPKPARSVAPIDKPIAAIDVVAEVPVADAVVTDAVVAERVVTERVVTEPAESGPAMPEAATGESPTTVASPFEVPTLDIAFPAAVPKVRDAGSPALSGRATHTPPASVSQQIIIPALELPEAGAEISGPAASPEGPIESSPEAPPFAEHDVAGGHGITPGQSIADYSPVELEAVVNWINRDGTPRDCAMIVTAVMAELGFKRKGKKITDAITAAAISTGALVDQPSAPDLTALAS